MLLFPSYFCQFQRRYRDQEDRGQSIALLLVKSGIWKTLLISVAKIGLLLTYSKIRLPHQPQAEQEVGCLPEAHRVPGREARMHPPYRSKQHFLGARPTGSASLLILTSQRSSILSLGKSKQVDGGEEPFSPYITDKQIVAQKEVKSIGQGPLLARDQASKPKS